MSEMNSIGQGSRPILVEQTTGYLLTTNPKTGEFMRLIDEDTGKPLKRRTLFVDPMEGCYCTIDLKTNAVSRIIDPFTGKPLLVDAPPAEELVQGEAAFEVDEEALAQADADDGEPDDGIARREGEAPLGDFLEAVEGDGDAAPTRVSESAAPATVDDGNNACAELADYMQMLPSVNTRDVARTDGLDIATLITVAAAIIVVLIGQMLYWALY